MNQFELPELAFSKKIEVVNANLTIDTRCGQLFLSQAKLSYVQFAEIMEHFLDQNRLSAYYSNYSDEEFNNIFSSINTALEKANLSNEQIDYVLFIGGSSKNPYLQSKLNEYFKDSDLLIPRELQNHVSAGAAIHSLIYNGFGKNIIRYYVAVAQRFNLLFLLHFLIFYVQKVRIVNDKTKINFGKCA